MSAKSGFYRFLMKLPLILGVLLTPITIYLVWTYNQPLMRGLGLSGGEEEKPPSKEVSIVAEEPALPGPENEKRLDPAPPPPPPLEVEELEEEPPAPAIDWAKEEKNCVSAAQFAALARTAAAEGEDDLSRRLYLEALHLDPENREAHLGVGDLLYNPEEHLADFAKFEGRQLEGWIASFKEGRGTWISPIELEQLRKAWAPVREELLAEVDKQENDPYEDLRRRHVRLSMRQHAFIEKVVKENDYWIDRYHPPYFLFIEGSRVREKERIDPLIDLLVEDLENVRSSFREFQGIEEDRDPELFFVWILKTDRSFRVEYGATERAGFDVADRALYLHTRNGLEDYADTDAFRQRTVDAFTVMLMDHYGKKTVAADPVNTVNAEINDLEAFIRSKANDPSIGEKRLRLADLYFDAARGLRPEDRGVDGPDLDDWVKETKAAHYENALFNYESVVASMVKAKGDAIATRGRIRLKAAVACWLFKDLLGIRSDERKALLRRGDGLLAEALWDLPPRDPAFLWAWCYAFLFASEQGRWPQCTLLLEGALAPQRQALDMKRTLSEAGESSWMITEPLGCLLSRAMERADEEESLRIVEYAEAFRESCDAAGVAPGLYADLLLLETYPSLCNPKDLGRAGKLLIEVSERNPGTAAGLKARPLLEEWVKAPEDDRMKKFSFYPEIVLALADELRAEGRYAEALEEYGAFLDLGSSKYRSQRKIVEDLGVEVAGKMGICCFYLSRKEEALKHLAVYLAGATEDDPLYETCLKYKDLAGTDNEVETAEPKAIGYFEPWPLALLDLPRDLKTPELFYMEEKKGKEDKAVQWGLDWLARHQNSDGLWDCDSFSSLCPLNDKCLGKGMPQHDIGVTGLALLAFIEDGNTLFNGPYQDRVAKGLRFLCRLQDEETGSLVMEVPSIQKNYDHAIATLALIEAYSKAPSPVLIEPVQKALAWIHSLKNPGRAWRYNSGTADPVEQNDVSVTGWMMRCLARGHALGFQGYEQDLKDALAYIDDMTDPGTGRTGYMMRGQFGAREAQDVTIWPPDLSEAITAVALECRYLTGAILDNLDAQEKVIEKGVKLLVQKPPRWNINGGCIDLYYWYYGTLALARHGGKDWKLWREAVVEEVLTNQVTEGCARGSWPPQVDPFGDYGGRIYSTALCTRMLQALGP